MIQSGDPEINRVLARVQSRLDEKRQTTGVALAVAPGGFRRDNGWLFITVAPGTKDVRTTDYVDLLGEVEDELHTEGLRHVLLVAALAD
jgi:hypothetical protein